jgi:hypothetical protein
MPGFLTFHFLFFFNAFFKVGLMKLNLTILPGFFIIPEKLGRIADIKAYVLCSLILVRWAGEIWCGI